MFASIWNSQEALSRCLWWLTFITLAAPALSGLGLYFVNDRIGDLQQGTIESLKADLNNAHKNIETLQKNAVDAQRGVSDTYDFNGGHRVQRNGYTSVEVGEESSIFRKIIKLNDDKNWIDLYKICNSQTKKTPTWLTPHLYSGVALANLGSTQDAITELEFVERHAGSDPQYSEAIQILASLRAKIRQ